MQKINDGPRRIKSIYQEKVQKNTEKTPPNLVLVMQVLLAEKGTLEFKTKRPFLSAIFNKENLFITLHLN